MADDFKEQVDSALDDGKAKFDAWWQNPWFKYGVVFALLLLILWAIF